MAQAKIKGLDEPGPCKAPVRKDVNTFINNQLKFSHSHGPNAIPASQMKCNILKAAAAQENKNTEKALTVELPDDANDLRLVLVAFFSLLASCFALPAVVVWLFFYFLRDYRFFHVLFSAQ